MIRPEVADRRTGIYHAPMRGGTGRRISRYPNHQEAIKGSFLWPLRLDKWWRLLLIGSALGASLGTVIAKLVIGETGKIPVTLAVQLCVLLAACFFGGVVMYAVNVVAGGIMSGEEGSRD